MLLSDATEDERDVGPSLIGNFKESSASPTKVDKSRDNDEIDVTPGNFDQSATEHMEIDDNLPDQSDAPNISTIEIGVEDVHINDKDESLVSKAADTTGNLEDDAHMQDDAEVDHLLTSPEPHSEHQASEDLPKDSTTHDVPPSLLDVSALLSEAKDETSMVVKDATSDNLPNPKEDSPHPSKPAAKDPNQNSSVTPLRNMFGFYKGKPTSAMAQISRSPPRALSNSPKAGMETPLKAIKARLASPKTPTNCLYLLH